MFLPGIRGVFVNVMAEIALIFVLCLVGEWIAALLPVAFPASVISMVILIFLLMTGVIKQRQIQTVSNFLVVNMGLFFVPALVGTLEYVDVLKARLVPFLVVALITTPIVYGVTAWTVQLLMRCTKKKGGTQDA